MALTTARATQKRLDRSADMKYRVPMAASTTLYKGALVCLNASGYAVPGSTATTLTALGVLGDQSFGLSLDRVVNSGSAGDVKVDIEGGTFGFDGTGGDLPTIADIGKVVYITDDETVCKTGTGKSIAGTLVEISVDAVTGLTQYFVAIGVTPMGLTGGVGPTGPTGPTG
jgi:hypothetical protein